MSVSLIGSPDDFSPAYNPVWYFFDSTNKDEPGFRYIVDLYLRTGNLPGDRTLVHRYRIAPRPDDGFCPFNLSRVMSSFLTNQLPDQLGGTEADDSHLRYDIEVGEEFSVEWEYTDNFFYPDTSSLYHGYTWLRNLDSPPDAHLFVVDDQINITQDSGTPAFPEINGLHTVVEIPDAFSIVIGLLFPGVASPEPGTVIFADNTKVIFPDLLDVTNKVLFNGAVRHEEYRTYDSVRFALNVSDQGTPISSCPSEFTVRPTTRMGFNWFNDFASEAFWMFTENDSGTIFRKLIDDPTYFVQYNPVGPGNIDPGTHVSGPVAPIFTDTTEWYEVYTFNNILQRTSARTRFVFDRRCTNFQEMEMIFLDRLGSLGSFSFIYRNDLRQNVTREDHKFLLGDLDGSSWTYSTFDAGSKTINVDATQSYTIRTAWLTDDESEYFKELVSSPVTWLDYGEGLFPVIVRTNSIRVGRRPADKNIRYEITVELANNEIVNI